LAEPTAGVDVAFGTKEGAGAEGGVGTTGLAEPTAEGPFGTKEGPVGTAEGPFGTKEGPVGTAEGPFGTKEGPAVGRDAAFAFDRSDGAPAPLLF
jgi:hypothetical protein